MRLDGFTDHERQVLAECLIAAANGPFFDEVDLRCLIGRSRSELLALASRLDGTTDCGEDIAGAVGLCLLNLTAYPHGQNGAWNQWFSATREQVAELDHKWEAARPRPEFTSVRVVHGPVLIDGAYYRVIGVNVNGGTGRRAQVWAEGHWEGYDVGPGYRDIEIAPLVPSDVLADRGVDAAPPPADCDPLAGGAGHGRVH